MARYNYDVDSRTKLLDTHKQFTGGLKTVDTDDSVKTFYLRNMSNLSLSEFGFLEKRYGQFIAEEFPIDAVGGATLQHYSNYNGVETLIINGKIYSTNNDGDLVLVELLHADDEVEDARYPAGEVLSDIGINLISPDPVDLLGAKTLGACNEVAYYNSLFGDHILPELMIPELQGTSTDSRVFNLHDSYIYEAFEYMGSWIYRRYAYGGATLYNIYANVEYDARSPKVYRGLGWGDGGADVYYHISEPVELAYYFIETTPIVDGSYLLQRFREIESVKIDDRIYFMTGTYPLYRKKDDDKFYIMPIYEPSYAESSQFSHNLLEDDFEELYRYNYTHPEMTVKSVSYYEYDEKYDTPFKAKDENGISYYPKLPFNPDPDLKDDEVDPLSGLNVKINFERFKNSDQFAPLGQFVEFIAHNEETIQAEEEEVKDFVYVFGEDFGERKMTDVLEDTSLTYANVGAWWQNTAVWGQAFQDKTMDIPTGTLAELIYLDTIGHTTSDFIAAAKGKDHYTAIHIGDTTDGDQEVLDDGSQFFNDTENPLTYVCFWRKLFGETSEDDGLTFQQGKIYKLMALRESDGKLFIHLGYFRWRGKEGRNGYQEYAAARESMWRDADNIKRGGGPVGFKNQRDWAFEFLGWGNDGVFDVGTINVIDIKPPKLPSANDTTQTEVVNYLETSGFESGRPQEDFILWELFPAVFTRPAGGTESEWLEVPKEMYNNRGVYTNAVPDANRTTLMSILDNDAQETPVFEQEEVTGSILFNREVTSEVWQTISGHQDGGEWVTVYEDIPVYPFEFKVKELPHGSLDIKITLVARKSGYYDDLVVDDINTSGDKIGDKIIHRWKQESFAVDEKILRDIVVTSEKVEDFTEFSKDDFGYPALWSCNRVFNHYGKMLVYGSPYKQDRVYISHPSMQNYFPYFFTMDFYTDSGQAVNSISSFMNTLVVQSETFTWGVSGIDAVVGQNTSYKQFTISPIYGTIAPKSVRAVRNRLFFLSKQGLVALKSIYSTDERYNVEIMDKQIRNIMVYDPDAVAIEWDNQYIINFPNSEDNLTLRYYIDKNAWVKDNYFYKKLDSNWSNVGFNGVFLYQQVSGDYLDYIAHPMTIAGGNASIYKIRLDKSTPTDLDENVFSYFETAFVNQNYPFHPKQYKEVKFDFSVQNEFNRAKEPVFIGNHLIFNSDPLSELVANHWYHVDYINDILPTSVTYEGVEIPFYEYENEDGTQTFIFKGLGTGDYDIYFDGATPDVSIYDVTYDDKITFKVWAMTEDNLLNLDDDIDSYDAELAAFEQNLGTNFGQQFVFGDSDFGNRTLATKTVRLAGKGKNIKVYFEEESKSKWTMETLGILFKIKRARGTR